MFLAILLISLAAAAKVLTLTDQTLQQAIQDNEFLMV